MDRFAVRRKILRGSLSAPLVLTVVSPSALARQSFEACLYRAKESTESARAFIAANSHDTWLRKRVALYSAKLTDDSTGKPILFFKEGDRYYLKDPGGCTRYNLSGYSEGELFALKAEKDQNRQVYELALVYVDLEGNVVNCGPCPKSGAFPVTTSCWASFGGMMQL